MSLVRVLILLLAMAAPAFADGGTRVLLADADPELQRAVKAALAPWRLDVVVEDVPSGIAESRTDARFVVWRENGELVVFDRERNEHERRAAPVGELDPASAAAAALTVKTLMRLPDAPPEEPTPIAPISDDGIGVRVQASGATRFTTGDDNVGARATIAAFVRPAAALRFGLLAEIGTAADIRDTGFKGTWSDWSVSALASYALPMGPRWEIEPYVGAGVLRLKVDGDESQGMGMMLMQRHERALLPLAHGGAFVRRRMGRTSIGAVIDLAAPIGTRAYTKTGNGSQFFAVPPFAVSVGAFVAFDLSR